MLIDSHAHLYFDNFKLALDQTEFPGKSIRDKFDQVVNNALSNGVGIIINVGVDIAKSRTALSQALTRKNIYSTIGIHPHEAVRYFSIPEDILVQDLTQLEQLYIDNPQKIVAVGECGLDFSFEENPGFLSSGLTIQQIKDLQIKVFTEQIKLAKKLMLPLIVHCRNAWPEMLPLLGNLTGVLHCYSGDEQITQQVLRTNLYISFAANITYPKNEFLRQAALLAPLDRILLETDSPFLAPQSQRGKINEPANVKEVARCLAEIKQCSFENVANQTTDNTLQLFRIPLI